MAAYRALVYETPGFTDYFFNSTPIRGSPNWVSAHARLTQTQPEIEVRHPWGSVRAMPPHPAGLVWFWHGDRGFPECRTGPKAPAGAAAQDGAAVAVFSALLSTWTWCSAKTTTSLASRYSELVQDAACAKRCSAPSSKVAATADDLLTFTGDISSAWRTTPGTLHRHRFPIDRSTTCRSNWSWRWRGAGR